MVLAKDKDFMDFIGFRLKVKGEDRFVFAGLQVILAGKLRTSQAARRQFSLNCASLAKR
jgi:hypothetical protein